MISSAIWDDILRHLACNICNSIAPIQMNDVRRGEVLKLEKPTFGVLVSTCYLILLMKWSTKAGECTRGRQRIRPLELGIDHQCLKIYLLSLAWKA